MPDLKITQLTALTAVEDSDPLPIVDDPTGSAQTKKITRANLLDSKIISTDLGIANKTAGINLPVGDNYIIDSNVQLTGSTADGFTDTTGLTIWQFPTGASGNPTTVVGTETMVLTGALTQSNDVLGTSRYNTFDGTNDWLICTDANFANMTNTFSYGVWFKKTNWSEAVTDTLGARCDDDNATNGWLFYRNSSGLLILYANSSVVCSVDIRGLSVDHHYFSFTWSAGNVGTIYIDGVAVASGTGTITAGGKFMIGATRYGSPTYKASGIFGEVFIDVNTCLTPDQIRNIYARSAKRFATKDANSNVNIEGKKAIIIYAPMTTSISSTSNISDQAVVSIVVPESRMYNIKAKISQQSNVASATVHSYLKYGSSYAGGTLIGDNTSAISGFLKYSEYYELPMYFVAGTTIYLGGDVTASGSDSRYILGDNIYKNATFLILESI